MFTLKIENPIGEIIKLTQNEANYQVIDISGLNPPNATIINTKVAGMDGSKNSSTRLEERNIVITVKLNGDIEKNRLKLYRYFSTKQWCKIYFQSNSRDIYAEGYIETNECSPFGKGQVMQISIVCPDPYFHSLKEIWSDISQVVGVFEFPFAIGSGGIEEGTTTDDATEFSVYVKDKIVNILNEGEVETGVTIEITATGTVTNPVIYNVNTHESFGINTQMVKGDVEIINTNSGQKSITRIRDGKETNEINKLVRGSTWLTLRMGDNLFTYTADGGAENMQIIFKHHSKYQAV